MTTAPHRQFDYWETSLLSVQSILNRSMNTTNTCIYFQIAVGLLGNLWNLKKFIYLVLGRPSSYCRPIFSLTCLFNESIPMMTTRSQFIWMFSETQHKIHTKRDLKSGNLLLTDTLLIGPHKATTKLRISLNPSQSFKGHKISGSFWPRYQIDSSTRFARSTQQNIFFPKIGQNFDWTQARERI